MKYLMLLFLLPVLIPAGTADPGITVRNSHFSVRLDDPALSDPNGTFGCRFLRAGWITALYPQGSRENLFHPVSISRYHKAFGCALEILPPLRLTPDRQLKLGIGIVEPHPVSRFQAKPIELFPWQTAIDESAGQTVLTARQSSGNHNGYAYELTVTVCIPVSTPEIIWRLDLHNTGSRKLDLLSYLHPFSGSVPNSPANSVSPAKTSGMFSRPVPTHGKNTAPGRAFTKFPPVSGRIPAIP